MVNVKIQYKKVDEKVDEKKIPTTVEEIIAARRKAKFERMKKFGVICFETPEEYNKYIKLMTEFKLATIIESTKKVTDEYNKLKTRLNMFHKPIIPISDPKLLDTPIEIDKLLKSNIRLFSQNEKLAKQIEKWQQLVGQQFNNFIKEPKSLNDKIKKIKTMSSPIKLKKSPIGPNGVCSPKPISDELREFIFTTSGRLFQVISSVDVSSHINNYIRQNSLQDKNNGRKINPDEKLSKLLGLKPTDELTYFNLQKYLRPHFIK
jgi:upstream activation factor subunit UAF30